MGHADQIDQFWTIEYFYTHDFNDVHDDSMLYYVEKMKDLKF